MHPMSTTRVDREGRADVLIPEWTFGDRIRKTRLSVGMDQRTFAENIGATASSLATWETDRVRPRDLIAVAKRIELLTRVPASWLLGLYEDPQPGGPAAGEGVARPERFELPTFWLVASDAPTSEESQREDVVVPFRRLEPVGAAA